jgi:hypothetical protein
LALGIRADRKQRDNETQKPTQANPHCNPAPRNLLVLGTERSAAVQLIIETAITTLLRELTFGGQDKGLSFDSKEISFNQINRAVGHRRHTGVN